MCVLLSSERWIGILRSFFDRSCWFLTFAVVLAFTLTLMTRMRRQGACCFLLLSSREDSGEILTYTTSRFSLHMKENCSRTAGHAYHTSSLVEVTKSAVEPFWIL